MDKNQVYIDRLRKVLWEHQEDLKKVTSYDFCTSCKEYVLTSNYCQQCGQMNFSLEMVSYQENQFLLNNSQYYMAQSNRWLDRWGYWLEEQLNKVGIEINQGVIFRLGSFHEILTIIFSIVSFITAFVLIIPSFSSNNIIISAYSLIVSLMLLFLNYQLYRGESHKTLPGIVGLILLSVLAMNNSLEFSILIISSMFLVVVIILLLLIIKPSTAQVFENTSTKVTEKVTMAQFKVTSALSHNESDIAIQTSVQNPNPSPNYNRSEGAFKYRHTGSTILNWLFFGIPLIVLLLSAQSLSEFLSNNGIYIGDSIFALILVATFVTFIYFLPAFICQSSGLKIVLWICLLLFGWTVIGWFILLLVATSSNKNRRRQQEMDYLIRKMADR
ncbi:superinfection immunity protein [Streptococcus suis]